MTGPTFSQKHYERLAALLHEQPPAAWWAVVQALCDAFERDNPRFKRTLFVRQCERGPEAKGGGQCPR